MRKKSSYYNLKSNLWVINYNNYKLKINLAFQFILLIEIDYNY